MVHPHARGDDKDMDDEDRQILGSPPRAWGRRLHLLRWPLRHRFTPTRVGTTNRAAVDWHTDFGSPPRAWGRPDQTQERRVSLRFTPTRVGTTPRPRWHSVRWPVHPHARGDDSRSSEVSAGEAASTPPAGG